MKPTDKKVSENRDSDHGVAAMDAVTRFSEGDRVRIDLPDESDPDHDRYHGAHGVIVQVLRDEAGDVTGDERDADTFRVDLDAGDGVDVRWRDLRQPIE